MQLIKFISSQLLDLEDAIKIFEPLYREDLQKSLGGSFFVETLTNYEIYSDVKDHFFPVDYENKAFGVIMPFRKRALGGDGNNLRSVDRVFVRFNNALEKKGYKVNHVFDNQVELVVRGRKD